LFVGMKRFAVKGYEYRFSEENLSSFIAKIEELKAQSLQNNLEFVDPKWGTISISPAKLEELINSFTIVVPLVREFSYKEVIVPLTNERGVATNYNRFFEVTVGVSLKFLDPQTGNIIENLYVKRKGVSSVSTNHIEDLKTKWEKDLTYFDKVRIAKYNEESNILINDAGYRATKVIINELKYLLRTVEKFRLYTRVLDIKNGRIFIELGRDYDIVPGLELDVVRIERRKIGSKEFEEKKVVGLIKVVDVKEEYSEAITILGSVDMDVQLVDALRRGFINKILVGGLYASFIPPVDNTLVSYFNNAWNDLKESIFPMVGFSAIVDSGFAHFEPQIDLILVLLRPISVILSLGGGLPLYFGNFKMKPVAMLDVSIFTDSIPDVSWKGRNIILTPIGTSIGVSGGISLELILSKSLCISLDVNGRYHFYYIPSLSAIYTDGSEVTDPSLKGSMVPLFSPTGAGAHLSLGFRF
ncbi:MAG: hypothetical protein ABDH28_05115, partial [Brevinematia bacterium]